MQFDQHRIETEDIEKIFDLIHRELEYAVQKFPMFPSDPLHAIAIVNEEAGEATKDTLQWCYEPHKDVSENTIKGELIQTAAMCIRMVCGLDSGDIRPDKQ